MKKPMKAPSNRYVALARDIYGSLNVEKVRHAIENDTQEDINAALDIVFSKIRDVLTIDLDDVYDNVRQAMVDAIEEGILGAIDDATSNAREVDGYEYLDEDRVLHILRDVLSEIDPFDQFCY